MLGVDVPGVDDDVPGVDDAVLGVDDAVLGVLGAGDDVLGVPGGGKALLPFFFFFCLRVDFVAGLYLTWGQTAHWSSQFAPRPRPHQEPCLSWW